MPSNDDFTVKIQVGGLPIPEYRHDGRYLVECNLDTEVSYKQAQTELINGERETQNWPVTPYEIELNAHASLMSPHYFRVLVDGVKVKGISLEPGTTQQIKGFRDGGCIREFLFSMPRFAQDMNDRISTERVSAVGKIEVQCWKAVLRKTKRGRRRKSLEFEQANKKDTTAVTKGQYTMATSKAGRVVCSRSIYRCVDNWKLIGLQSKIHIEYHMAHTLQDMGLILRPITCDPVYVQNSRRLPAAAEGSVASSLQGQPVNLPVELIDLTGEDSDDGGPELKRRKSVEVEIKQEPDIITSTKTTTDATPIEVDNNAAVSVTIPSQSQSPPAVVEEGDKDGTVAADNPEANSPKTKTSASSSKEKETLDENDANERVNIDPPQANGEVISDISVEKVVDTPSTGENTAQKDSHINGETNPGESDVVESGNEERVADTREDGEKDMDTNEGDGETNEGDGSKEDGGAGDSISKDQSTDGDDQEGIREGGVSAETGKLEEETSSADLLAEMDSIISKTDPKNSAGGDSTKDASINKDTSELDVTTSPVEGSNDKASSDVTSGNDVPVSEGKDNDGKQGDAVESMEVDATKTADSLNQGDRSDAATSETTQENHDAS